MVRWLFSFLEREIRGLHEAAYLLAFFALLSQVLALVRDRSFAHTFGAGEVLDVYFAAFRIPDLTFAFLTLFVSSFALVPLLSSRSKTEQSQALGALLIVFGIGSAAAAGALYLALPWLVPLIAPGFSPELRADVLTLSSIMLLQPIILGFSSIAASLAQATRQFVLFALAPIAYNLGIIAGIVFLYPEFGVAGLAWGVVCGALLHLLVQAAPLIRTMRVRISVGVRELREICEQIVGPSLPRSLSLAANQGLLVLFAALASLVGVGAVSALSLGFNLAAVPVTVIGVSYAAALFPALSKMVGGQDLDSYARELWAAVRHAAFWLLPASMLFIVLRAHGVRVVLGSGAFSWDDTRLTAAIVGILALSLLPQALILMFSRAYYALNESVRPILLNVSGAALAAALAAGLLSFVTAHPAVLYFVEAILRVSDVHGTAALMLPLAYTATMFLVAAVFWIMLAKRFQGGAEAFASVSISAAASVIGAGAAYLALRFFGPLLPTETFVGIFLQAAGAACAGGMSWILVLFILRSRELADVLTLLRGRVLAVLGRS